MTQGMWKNEFGDNLAALLRERGVSQKQLSMECGISMGMLSDYINKFTTPNIFAVINMAYSLDVDVDDLIDFGEPIEY